MMCQLVIGREFSISTMFNEIDSDFDEVAIKTFKVGLPPEYDLRKSLIGKSVTSLRQLMDRVDKYKRIEDDQQ